MALRLLRLFLLTVLLAPVVHIASADRAPLPNFDADADWSLAPRLDESRTRGSDDVDIATQSRFTFHPQGKANAFSAQTRLQSKRDDSSFGGAKEAKVDAKAADAAARAAFASVHPRSWSFSSGSGERHRGEKSVVEMNLAHLHDTGFGPVVATFATKVHGIPVHNDRLAVVLTRDLTPVGASGVDEAAKAITHAELTHAGSKLSELFTRPAAAAVAVAAADRLGLKVVEVVVAPGTQPEQAGFEPFAVSVSSSNVSFRRDARAKRVFYRLGSTLAPAYYLEIWVRDARTKAETLHGYVVSADATATADILLLSRQNLGHDIVHAYRVWADDTADISRLYTPPGSGPLQDFMPRDSSRKETDSLPSAVSPRLVSLDHAPFLSKNDPWISSGAETLGNNVDAYFDRNAPDGYSAGDQRARVTSPNTFDRVYNTSESPFSSNQVQAAITQLFFTINWLHDWFYDFGFDEIAGNAQKSNYGRGGADNDAILAEAQDFSGMNNANMLTPQDGANPRMQMFVFTFNSQSGVIIAGSIVFSSVMPVGPDAFDVSGVLRASTGDGCSAYTNALPAGTVAIVADGSCSIIDKALWAQAAGAVGVLVTEAYDVDFSSEDIAETGINIPVAYIRDSSSTDAVNYLNNAQANPDSIIARIVRTAVTGPYPPSSLDNFIVTHEWAHYLTNRLGALIGQQARGMGEGWSDFVGLLVEARAGDPPDAVYVGGGYAVSNVFWGIRRFPYSTNMTEAPLTYKHISGSSDWPTGQPFYASRDRGDRNAVHAVGEIWANMLWECYSALVADTRGPSPRLTFVEAQNRMKSYLVAALKLMPVNPTILEARDAQIAAAAAGDFRDGELFCQAFARRGAGTSAVGPPRNSSRFDEMITESYSCSGVYDIVSVELKDSLLTCDGADGILDLGESGTLSITIFNNGGATLAAGNLSVVINRILTSAPLVNVTSLSATWHPIPSLVVGMSTTIHINVALTAAAELGQRMVLSFILNAAYASQDSVQRTVAFVVNENSRASAVTFDNADAAGDIAYGWEVSNYYANSEFDFSRARSSNVLNGYYHAPVFRVLNDVILVSPAIQVGSNLTLTFAHRFEFDDMYANFWQGGVVEISTDGQSWIDIMSSRRSNAVTLGRVGYLTFELPAYLAKNPLFNRSAFVGSSPAYPSWTSETFDLGTGYSGMTVRIRFRLGMNRWTDLPVGGWDIDDIQIYGSTNTPFPETSVHFCITTSSGQPDVQQLSAGNNTKRTNLVGVCFCALLYIISLLVQ